MGSSHTEDRVGHKRREIGTSGGDEQVSEGLEDLWQTDGHLDGHRPRRNTG